MLNQTKTSKTMSTSRTKYSSVAQFAFIKTILAGFSKQLQTYFDIFNKVAD
jgi:hypothetical protein